MRKNILKLINRFLKPKIVMCIETHGCMAQIHDVIWIGIIKKTYFKDGIDFHEIRVLKKGHAEQRDIILNPNTQPIADELAYQIQHIGANLYAFYI